MGSRRKKICRMMRGLLKQYGMSSLVAADSHPEGVRLKIHGVDQRVVFSIQRLIKHRVDNYEQLTYEDLKAEMPKFWKEILFVRAVGEEGLFGVPALQVKVADSKGFVGWEYRIQVEDMKGHP